jgi:TonB family protein
MPEAEIRKRRSSRHWLVIVLIAVLVHLVVFFGIQPRHLNIFRKSFDDKEASSSRRASHPDAIIAVTVDVEGEKPLPVEITELPRERPTPAVTEHDKLNDEESETDDLLDDILGTEQTPLPSLPSTTSAVIPPRPVEITWPETKNLSHCRDLHVDVRIQVDENGKILGVETIDGQVPDECAQAAIRAARRIVFLPGRVNGQAETMWTEIRIDFRRQSR